MRFIGGKTNLLTEIHKEISERAPDARKIIDIFSGSGAVTSYLKENDYDVIGNDIMYFAYALSRGSIALDKEPDFASLGVEDPISHLNSLSILDTDIDINDCFIYRNYAPNENSDRMYFREENAIKIDVIRLAIEDWREKELLSDDEYYYLLSSLIAAVPYVSNITGVYGAYLKHWDKRTYNELTIRKPKIITSGRVVMHNENCDTLLPKLSGDLLYADPPYNSRQYLPNYHVLETIAKYDYPSIRGVTGMRDYESQKSDFCSKTKVEDAFARMIEQANVQYVLISYNSEGLLSTKALSEICRSYAKEGSFNLKEINYRRYNNVGTSPGGVREQLYFFEKK